MNDAKAPELLAFQRYQLAFTAHLRDPRAHPRPRKVEARRMALYRELLYNSVESALLACFPVLRQVLGERKWSKLVREFLAQHRSQAPYFRQIPDEFIRFLQDEWTPAADYPPFMLELAHYEWIELVLSVSAREADLSQLDTRADLLEARPVLNPVMSLLGYVYPVHRIGPRFKPVEVPAQTTQLLVLRDLTDRMRFIVLNPVSARLVSLLETGELSGRAALLRLAKEMHHPEPENMLRFGMEILQNLRAEQAILGSR
ncbi:MAG TPA: putative DNA-binding domain-containing protein [Sulfuriferula sp.]|nr:putative DNA-binding domain-containing protein [Sulfuriferula sp.]